MKRFFNFVFFFKLIIQNLNKYKKKYGIIKKSMGSSKKGIIKKRDHQKKGSSKKGIIKKRDHQKKGRIKRKP
jgi:hypothetical protein